MTTRRTIGRSFFYVSLALVTPAISAAPAVAQTNPDRTRIAVYPILGWAPVFGADFRSIPDIPGGGGGGGTGGGSGEGTSGGSIDTSLNGALLFGFAIDTGPWRFEADGMWAALRGERPERPILEVDVDAIYAHGGVSRRLFRDFYVSGGFRRLALKYQIELEGLTATFEDKPGFWDPLIGVGWHRIGETWELHATLDANVFDTGAKSDTAGGVRVDWKPLPRFGLTFGYAIIHLEIEKTIREQTLSVEQTLHGPILGIGFYF